MEIFKVDKTQLVALVLLIAGGVTLRLLPHEPNFAPIGAIALFGGAVLGWRTAVWLPLVAMITSDLVIGFYPGIAFTWTAFLLVAAYGMLYKKAPFWQRVSLGTLGGAVIFFAVSNFGVWVLGNGYAPTLAGLTQCYALALPFFRATLFGDAFYGFVLFGAYALVMQMRQLRALVAASPR